MEPFLTLFWIAVAFGIWYAATRARRPGGRSPGSGRAEPRRSAQPRRTQARMRDTRLRTVEAQRQPARVARASADVRAIDDPVTALATLALVLTGEDATPTGDVKRTLRDRLSGLTDEVHVARALNAAQKLSRRGDNPHAVIKTLTPLFERHLTPRERADVVAVCEDVVSATGLISDQQSVWLRSLRRSLGFEVKG